MPRPSELTPRIFKLKCEGVEWQGWTSFSIRQSLDDVSHSMSLETTDRLNGRLANWNVRGGSFIEFEIDGIKVFAGFVQKYSVSIDNNAHSISLEAASRSIDAVECSHLGPYFWKNTNPETVINDVLRPFGFSAIIDRAMKPIDKSGYRVDPDKKPFEIIKELAERDSLTVLTDMQGNFRLSDGKNAPFAGKIIPGDFIAINADHDFSEVFSEIVVKSQQNDREKPTKASFDKKQRNQAISKNNKILQNPKQKPKQSGFGISSRQNVNQTRFRPLVYVKNDSEDAAKSFADLVKTRFTSDVIAASVTLKSHRTTGGIGIWGIGQEVELSVPMISVEQRLIISAVEFSVDESSGFQAQLSLKIPNGYDPQSTAKLGQSRRETGEFGLASQALFA